MIITVPERKSLGRLIGQPGETLTAALKRTLLEMILFGYFNDGKRLLPQELASHFDVSPTPVREALMQLSTEGYIAVIPRRGFRIKHPTRQLVQDLWQVRLGLELMAVEQAIARLEEGSLDPGELDPIAAIQRRRDELGARMNPKQHIELNAAFHQQLVALSGNNLLVGIYAAIQLQVVGALVQSGSTAWRGRLQDDSKEHHAILAAIRARDPARCALAVRQHVGRSLGGALEDVARRSPEIPATQHKRRVKNADQNKQNN